MTKQNTSIKKVVKNLFLIVCFLFLILLITRSESRSLKRDIEAQEAIMHLQKAVIKFHD